MAQRDELLHEFKHPKTGRKPQMPSEKQRDILSFNLAKDFILGLNAAGVTETLLNTYLHPNVSRDHVASIPELYKRLLESAQNANMKPGVIGGAIGGVQKLNLVLSEFDPKYVTEHYETWETVFDRVKKKLKPAGKMRRSSRSIWPQYCRTILSSARFIQQFSTTEDFYKWVEFFDNDNRARVALPMLLAEEIEGFGFALACDFLKELGFVNFAKPDIHIRDIFKGLKLCPGKANDYHLFKSVIRVAAHAGVTPYAADKIFWLVGSGYFYANPEIGNNGRIPRPKEKFIRFAKQHLLALNN